MTIPSEDLYEKLRGQSAGCRSDRSIRLSRAIAWTGRAQKETNDPSAEVIFFWISFNALYATEREWKSERPTERNQIDKFLERIASASKRDRLIAPLSVELRDELTELVGNRFVYARYWDYLSGDLSAKNWKDDLEELAEEFVVHLHYGEALPVLKAAFDRLYTLRCQIMHGSSTWRGDDHREQVKQGASILSVLVPTMIDIALATPKMPFGSLPYRPINPGSSSNLLSAAE